MKHRAALHNYIISSTGHSPTASSSATCAVRSQHVASRTVVPSPSATSDVREADIRKRGGAPEWSDLDMLRVHGNEAAHVSGMLRRLLQLRLRLLLLMRLLLGLLVAHGHPTTSRS